MMGLFRRGRGVVRAPGTQKERLLGNMDETDGLMRRV
jgi:hypothetical protein